MKKKRVILVSGMSGAGKTSATSVLEDMGYHCIDQFPVQLLSLLVDLIESSTDPRYSYLALATSAKDFPEFLNAFEGEDMDVRVLFLDASNEVLLHRYKSTRRTHPLLISNVCNTLEEAISVERQMFQNYKDTAFLSVDTTFLKASELKQKIEKYFSLSSAPVFSISFISFGYKHGVPLDADLMLSLIHIFVIEHNLDVIKCADYIIDIGPEGGDQGGTIIAKGTPEQIVKVEKSYTGQYLKSMLEKG